MTVPAVPSQSPEQSQLNLPDIANPYLSVWWTSQTASGVPENVMGWLVAQGWEITGVTWDNTTTPATASYALSKQGLQPWQVLLSLCNSYTVAANDARWANETRYNQIVANWTEMTSSTQTHFDNQITEQNTQAGVYLADLDTYMDEVDALIDANQAAILVEEAAAKVEVAAMLAKLADLETNADANSDTAESSITDQAGYVATLVNEIAAQMDDIGADYLAHLAVMLSRLTTIDSDYSSHAATAVGYLTDLGTTELARINEQFQATLSTQLQQLVDRGLYSSAVATDITERNERDRDEQIQALNDRLSREQLANQHQLYGQQLAVQQLHLGTRDKLYEQLFRIAQLYLDSYDKKYAARQDASRTSVTIRANLLNQLQEAVKGVIAGKERYATITMQHASIVAEHKHKAIVQKMNEAVARLEGWKTIADQNRTLMAYQLDERNKLLIGLYGFVERRDDIGPEWKEMASMIAGLGDSAGGWVTP